MNVLLEYTSGESVYVSADDTRSFCTWDTIDEVMENLQITVFGMEKMALSSMRSNKEYCF